MICTKAKGFKGPPVCCAACRELDSVASELSLGRRLSEYGFCHFAMNAKSWCWFTVGDFPQDPTTVHN